MALGKLEAALDVTARDGVKRTGEPVAEIEGCVAAIASLGVGRAAAPRSDVVLAGIAERRQGARLGPFARRVVARGDAPEELLG